MQENRIVWIEHLRALATIGVILLHVSAPLTYQFGSIPMSHWWIANGINSAVRCSVPLFFMISGALLLSKEYEIGVFWKKRVTRVLLPFLFWSVVHILMNLVQKYHTGELHTSADYVQAVSGKLQSGVAFHYWFVYVLVGIYLFIPILGKWIRAASNKEIVYFLALWLMFTFLSQTAFGNFRYFSSLSYFFSGSIGFVVLGYYLCFRAEFFKKIKSSFLVLLIIIGLIITTVGIYLLSVSVGKSSQTLYSYFTPNVMLVTVAVFLLISRQVIKNRIVGKTLSFVSKYSYGIYLSHILTLTVLTMLKIDGNFIYPLVGITLTSALCLGLSTLIVYLISRLPYGKYVAG